MSAVIGTMAALAIVIFVFTFSSDAAILRVGKPLLWPQSKPFLKHVRESGVEQFANHYSRCKGICLPFFLWGDEIEYGIFKYDEEIQRYDLSLVGTKIREQLISEEKKLMDLPAGCEWQPEYGSWMIEAVPRNPYGNYLSDLLNVEKNMALRRKRLRNVLKPNEIAPTVSNFPMLGTEGYKHNKNLHGTIANSQYVSDEIINPHPRFGTLTNNIRARRGTNVNITVPADNDPDTVDLNHNKEELIHMDAMAFGMGCGCLQVTIQTQTESESRFLNDQLSILVPLLQALSASTPIMRGRLTATDCRWNAIEQSVDDRTDAERSKKSQVQEDPLLAGGGTRPLRQSRYNVANLYIGKTNSEEEQKSMDLLNDVPVDINTEAYEYLLNQGIDQVMAKHIAHLFVRDPLVIFEDLIQIDNTKQLDHFENIQSTNWQSMRWKTPGIKLGLEFAKRLKQQQNQKDSNENINFDEIDEIYGVNPDYDFDHNILTEDRFFFNDTSDVDYSVPKEKQDVDDKSTTRRKLEEDLQSIGPGWRVEFRPLEVQLTDFENAAYSMIVVLISRCLLACNTGFNSNLNLYMPTSYIEENMRRAQLKDAVNKQKFWIRRNAVVNKECVNNCNDLEDCDDCFLLDENNNINLNTNAVSKVNNSPRFMIPKLEDIEMVELTLDEIFNGEKPKDENMIKMGKNSLFPGILPVVREYIKSQGCSDKNQVFKQLSPYLNLLQDRAAGKIPTTAQWIRKFVLSHPEYKKDGKLTSTINDDLLKMCEQIGMGEKPCPELYGTEKVLKPLNLVEESELMYSNNSCAIEAKKESIDVIKTTKV